MLIIVIADLRIVIINTNIFIDHHSIWYIQIKLVTMPEDFFAEGFG